MTIKYQKFLTVMFLLLAVFLTGNLIGQNTDNPKPRLLVLTDIGGDPDDIQSLRRLLVYSNEFRIEGLIATATWGRPPNRRMGRYFINEHLIEQAVADYAKDYSNLRLHDRSYPSPEELKAVIKGGQKDRGVENLAPGNATPGSSHIIATVDASEEPLWVNVWGGATDLAQALLDVKETRTPEEVERFVQKLRVYSIGDQDLKFGPEGTGDWIRKNFPEIFYIESGPQWVRSEYDSFAGYRGVYQNDTRVGPKLFAPLVKEGNELNDTTWVKENVLPYGAIGAGYPPSVNIIPNTPRNSRGVKEGDTPAWFYVLPKGLNDPEHPEWGGWGGRFAHLYGNFYSDTQDDHWSGSSHGGIRRGWTVARWRVPYQNDFAARMRWCTQSVQEANHNPVAVVDGDESRDILIRNVRKGTTLDLDATGSYDPDDDDLRFNWWIYHEASSGLATLLNENDKTARVEIPSSSPVGDVHVILEVTDNGSPQLFSYRRIIVRIAP